MPFTVDTVATGLDVPWDIAFLPDGRVLVTERSGRIRVLRDGELDPRPWAELDVAQAGETGLLGIDVAPDFADTGHVYVALTVDARRGWLTRIAGRVGRLFGLRPQHAIVTHVVRLTDRDGRGVDPAVVAGPVPAGQIHVGGALRFSPDARLFLGTGDAGIPELAADPESAAGAVLDVTGGEQAVIATGLRNVQGIGWRPADGAMFAIDHGPTGLVTEGRRTGNDELNAIVPDRDYGWPFESGVEDWPQHTAPRLVWSEAIAPAGMAYASDGPWRGDLFVGALAARDLIRVGFDETGAPACTRPLLGDDYGRIRAIRAGPGGALWVGTSNRDGRGRPGPADDLLLRLRPAPTKSPRPLD